MAVSYAASAAEHQRLSWLGGGAMQVLLDGGQTGGRLAMFRRPRPPAASLPGSYMSRTSWRTEMVRIDFGNKQAWSGFKRTPRGIDRSRVDRAARLHIAKGGEMGVVAERLAKMVVTVSSPDGQIEGELRDNDALSLSFRGDAYRHYTEENLGRQLSRLALRMWTGYQRGYDYAVSEGTGQPVERSQETWDANRRRFREAQANTTSSGFSVNGWVYAETTGMVSWTFVVRDGALATLDESGFVAEALSAFHALNHDYRNKMSDLRAEHYGVSFSQAKPK